LFVVPASPHNDHPHKQKTTGDAMHIRERFLADMARERDRVEAARKQQLEQLDKQVVFPLR
jgi:hypothetical protein